MTIPGNKPSDLLRAEDIAAIPADERSNTAQLCANPLVSIVMMTRNHEQYVGDAIKSVMAQRCTFQFEILIGEDFSSDGTLGVCDALLEKYPTQIRLVTAQQNVGITANFLRLAYRARGKYIAFLEGDDLWTDPNKLQIQVDLLDSHPEFSWCATRTDNREFWADVKQSYSLSDVLRRYIFHTSSVVFRTELLQKYPAFPDAVCWESMLFACLSQHGECGFIDRTTSHYRRHDGGLWTGADLQKKQELAHLFTDTMEMYFQGEYREELADRELWITRMNVTPVIETWDRQVWQLSRRAVGEELRRVARDMPLAYAGLALSVYLQPLTVFWRRTRRKLALRSRLYSLKNLLARRNLP